MEQMTIEQVGGRMHAVEGVIDGLIGTLDLDGFTPREVDFMLIGMECALLNVRGAFLGGWDESKPEAVENTRSLSDAQLAAKIAGMTAELCQKYARQTTAREKVCVTACKLAGGLEGLRERIILRLSVLSSNNGA